MEGDGFSLKTIDGFGLTMSPETLELLMACAEGLEGSPGEAIACGLMLLKDALDANANGMHMGIARDPKSLDRMIVGFGRERLTWVAEGSPSPPSNDGSSSPNGISSQG